MILGSSRSSLAFLVNIRRVLSPSRATLKVLSHSVPCVTLAGKPATAQAASDSEALSIDVSSGLNRTSYASAWAEPQVTL
jgi:hypothetical protein